MCELLLGPTPPPGPNPHPYPHPYPYSCLGKTIYSPAGPGNFKGYRWLFCSPPSAPKLEESAQNGSRPNTAPSRHPQPTLGCRPRREPETCPVAVTSPRKSPSAGPSLSAGVLRRPRSSYRRGRRAYWAVDRPPSSPRHGCARCPWASAGRGVCPGRNTPSRGSGRSPRLGLSQFRQPQVGNRPHKWPSGTQACP